MIRSSIQWYRRNHEFMEQQCYSSLHTYVYLSQAGVAPVVDSHFFISTYDFKIDGADVQSALALETLPWTFMFVVGMISDNLTIFGYNVKPYLFVMTVLGAIATLASGISALTPNFNTLSYELFAIRLYGAFADCLGESLIIKSGKKDDEDSSSGLQSISWFSYAAGGAIFGIIASQLQTDVTKEDEVSIAGSRTYTLLTSIFPVLFFVLVF